MNGLSTLLAILGGVCGLLGAVAAAAVYLRASYAKARIDALNAEIQEETRRSAQLRTDVGELKAQNAVLAAEVKALDKLVSQREQLDAMRAAIEGLREDVRAVGRTLTPPGGVST